MTQEAFREVIKDIYATGDKYSYEDDDVFVSLSDDKKSIHITIEDYTWGVIYEYESDNLDKLEKMMNECGVYLEDIELKKVGVK